MNIFIYTCSYAYIVHKVNVFFTFSQKGLRKIDQVYFLYYFTVYLEIYLTYEMSTMNFYQCSVCRLFCVLYGYINKDLLVQL